MTGQRFGKLIVMKRDMTVGNKRGAHWICKCDCGNIKTIKAWSLKSGATLSCGCYNRELMSRHREITGMVGTRFGKLVVVKRHQDIIYGNQKKVAWECQCDCGNTTVVASQDLKSGHTKSCGCAPTKTKGDGLIDLIGKQFGKLTVIERTDDYSYYRKDGTICCSPKWLCKCDCGNYVKVQGGNLRNGYTTNCGCARVYSKGEYEVSIRLDKSETRYVREYFFEDLKNISGRPLRFDFAILSSNIADSDKVIALIEYQGAQHYNKKISFGLYQREYTDQMKRDYCKLHNIPLYEIRYDEDLDKALNNILKQIKE